jgi:hypothetical protein
VRLRVYSSCALVLVIVGVYAAAGSARSSSAARVPVRGRLLRGRGYTLLAMSRDGAVTAVKIGSSGAFTVSAGRDYTLQLLSPTSRYFGPIVLAHKGARAYEALAGRALNLGTVRALAGFAAPVRPVAARYLDTHVWARASHAGRPIGAGNLGLIRRHHATKASARRAAAYAAGGPCEAGGQGGPGCSGGASGAGGEAGEGVQNGTGALPPGGDPTHVGIVTAFNADPTGAGVPANESEGGAAASGAGLQSDIEMPLEESVNADAAGVTAAQISKLVENDLQLDIGLQPTPAAGTVTAVTINCGTLVYCAEGTGTTVVRQGSAPKWTGVVPENPQQHGSFQINLAPRASTAQIHPGDVFQLNYQTASGTVTVPTTLTTYFVTVPAVTSYDAGAGAQTVNYPVPAGAPGTPSNPIRMSSGSITLTLYRPQRAALPGETGEFVDVGRLHYGVAVRPPGGQEMGCASSYYSNLSPTLTVDGSSQNPILSKVFPLDDSAEDAAPNPSSTMSFTLDLAGCLAADGISAAKVIKLPISADDDASDTSVQNLSVCLPGCNPNETEELQGPGNGGAQGQQSTERGFLHSAINTLGVGAWGF